MKGSLGHLGKAFGLQDVYHCIKWRWSASHPQRFPSKESAWAGLATVEKAEILPTKLNKYTSLFKWSVLYSWTALHLNC